MHGLRDLRIVDFSEGIAGPYASKLLAGAGAEVIKVEAPGGDPMRAWSATGGDTESEDGALFRFLHTSKRSIVGAPEDPQILALVEDADLVIEDYRPSRLDLPGLCARSPRLVTLSITPFGRRGPYADRPATEFTVQAECGSIGTRGLPEMPPVMAAGRITEWLAGTFSALAALAAMRRARETGLGEQIDFSLAEVMNIASTSFADLFHGLAGRPELTGPARSVEIPSIEPTLDGWVGFNTNSRQQYHDFLVLIERTDLLADEELARIDGRSRRMQEWNEIVRAYTRQHPTAEIVEKASLLRIPVAPVLDGRGVLAHEHFQARAVFVENPSGGFLQPRSPYLMLGESLPPLGTAPRLDEHHGQIEPRGEAGRRTATAGTERKLPLDGIRVLDATAWWAGPAATGMLAFLGAEVIHLESHKRPDGMRMTGGLFAGLHDDWWELSAIFLGANVNKKALTLDLSDPEGKALMGRLIEKCDVFVENFSPRVVESWGFGWEAVQALNPRCVMVRMPAFGLSGPWRDNVGFAQTMEQMTGLAWLTGHVEDQPRIQRGPCDPLAAMHAGFATLVGLAERDATGRGQFLECTMVEGALNAAAEQIVEYSAYGNSMQREGNRAPYAAPQGVYACRGQEQWLAVSVATDAQWQALVEVLGGPEWARAPELASLVGRRQASDRLDTELSRWAADRDLEASVETLLEAGVPAAPVVDPRTTSRHPQFKARGFYEECEHPIAGKQQIATAPFRFASVERWLRSPAPTLGQHNREILGDLLGLDDAEIDALEASGVIGDRLTGV